MTRQYLDIHRPHSQALIDGIPFDPTLPPDFEVIAHEERDPLEVQDWFCRPYIRTYTWSDREAYYRDLRVQGMPPEFEQGHYSEDWWPADGTDESFEVDLAEYRGRWFESFPDGVRYTVYSMGRAAEGDQIAVRWRGCCASVADAIAVAHAGDDVFKDVDIKRRLVFHHEHRAGFE